MVGTRESAKFGYQRDCHAQVSDRLPRLCTYKRVGQAMVVVPESLPSSGTKEFAKVRYQRAC
jgi:hypothetical protein